jgi:hypothetical protein
LRRNRQKPSRDHRVAYSITSPPRGQRRVAVNAERFSGLEIDYRIEFCHLFDTVSPNARVKRARRKQSEPKANAYTGIVGIKLQATEPNKLHKFIFAAHENLARECNVQPKPA